MKYFLVLVLIYSIYIGCKKESMIIADAGSIFNFARIKADSAIDIGNIYETKNFVAFTDIASYNGVWYTVFRVGTSHYGGEEGQIKILTSADGMSWKVMNNIKIDDYDLRDPKLTLDTINDDLYLSFFGKKIKHTSSDVKNYVSKFNPVANSWEAPQTVQYDNENGEYVFWRYTYHKSQMYCIAYRTPASDNANNLCLFISNGGNFLEYASAGKIALRGKATETTLRFKEKDSMYFVARTESINSPLGISLPDYKKTNWIDNPLSTILASPNFLFYKDKIYITGRDSRQSSFKLFCYDPSLKIIKKTYIFPSGHETGYGGMSFNPLNPDELWVTYYSVTRDSTSIKLAKINLLKF